MDGLYLHIVVDYLVSSLGTANASEEAVLRIDLVVLRIQVGAVGAGRLGHEGRALDLVETILILVTLLKQSAPVSNRLRSLATGHV